MLKFYHAPWSRSSNVLWLMEELGQPYDVELVDIRADVPEAYRDRVDTAAFGPGERLVFEPYSPEIFDKTQDWVAERDIFTADKLNQLGYAEATVLA